MASQEAGRGKTAIKRRRITRACDYCNQRSIRCRPAEGNDSTCANCRDFNQPCTYQRKVRRRGPQRQLTCSTTNPTPARFEDYDVEQSGPRWKAPFIANQASIMDLVELYFEIVYPVFPLFHQPSFMRRISRAEYTENKPLFATTMAVCALVSGRVRDGSVTNPRWSLSSIKALSPDIFYHEAQEQLAIDGHQCTADLHSIRAHAILAIAAIQNGRVRDMHLHLGIYHTLVAMDGLHDEANWPESIGVIEREERRRLVCCYLLGWFL